MHSENVSSKSIAVEEILARRFARAERRDRLFNYISAVSIVIILSLIGGLVYAVREYRSYEQSLRKTEASLNDLRIELELFSSMALESAEAFRVPRGIMRDFVSTYIEGAARALGEKEAALVVAEQLLRLPGERPYMDAVEFTFLGDVRQSQELPLEYSKLLDGVLLLSRPEAHARLDLQGDEAWRFRAESVARELSETKARSPDLQLFNSRTQFSLFVSLENWGNAERVADSILASEEAEAMDYVRRAFVRRKMGNNEGAMEDIEEALELDASLPAAYVEKCWYHFQMKDVAEAKAACDEAISLDRFYGRARHLLGEILFSEGKIGEAAHEWLAASQLYTSRYLAASALENVVAVHIHEEDWRQAQRANAEVRLLDMSLPSVSLYGAIIDAKRCDPSSAALSFRKWISQRRSTPESVEALKAYLPSAYHSCLVAEEIGECLESHC